MTRLILPLLSKSHDKTAMSSIDSDQPGHKSSLIRVFTGLNKESNTLYNPFSTQGDPDQTGRMPGHLHLGQSSKCWICHKAGFESYPFAYS